MQSSLLNSTLEDKNLSEIPNFKYVFLLVLHIFLMSVQIFYNIYVGLLHLMRLIILHHRLLLKQLVTMEVIQWTNLWETYKNEFENEKNLLGGHLGDKAAEDLRERIIEHVN